MISANSTMLRVMLMSSQPHHVMPDQWRAFQTEHERLELDLSHCPLRANVVLHRLVREGPRASRPRRYQPGLVGEHDRLHAVTQAELAEHVRHMGLDGALANVQFVG